MEGLSYLQDKSYFEQARENIVLLPSGFLTTWYYGLLVPFSKAHDVGCGDGIEDRILEYGKSQDQLAHLHAEHEQVLRDKACLGVSFSMRFVSMNNSVFYETLNSHKY